MSITDGTTAQGELQLYLKQVLEDCQRLREEHERLRAMLGLNHSTSNQTVPQGSLNPNPLRGPSGVYTPERKITLFRNLFRGREDVFAIRWEGKGGKSGYSPAGVMDWRAIHAAKPENRKGVGRKTRRLQPLTDDVIRNHLTGKHTIGLYLLLPDETCWVLAVDFDKKSWMYEKRLAGCAALGYAITETH
jgi:hypothetical protein